MHPAPLRRWRNLLASVAGLALSAAAAANPVLTVESLTLFRGGTLADWTQGRNILLDDEFDNGDPFSGPLYTGSTTDVSTYVLPTDIPNRAGLLSESGGQLRIDPSLAPVSAGATGRTGLSARLRLLTNISDPNRGLPLARSFAVAANLDLDALPAVGQSFGLRLTDNFNNNNDVLELSLTANHGLSWRRQDFVAGTITNYGFLTMNVPVAAEGVVLMLAHETANDPTIRAGWGFTDANGELIGASLNFFDTTAAAFHGEVHTRLELRATQTLPVPEPSTVALLAGGWLVVAATARRRQRAARG